MAKAKDKREVARAIRNARYRLGLSQETCAARVGVSRMQWIRYERGDNSPKGDHALAISVLLSLPPSLFAARAETGVLVARIVRDIEALVDLRVDERLRSLPA